MKKGEIVLQKFMLQCCAPLIFFNHFSTLNFNTHLFFVYKKQNTTRSRIDKSLSFDLPRLNFLIYKGGKKNRMDVKGKEDNDNEF
jgi:hypothetical protein